MNHESENLNSPTTMPFLFGAQYYRAPTPDRSLWADDIRRMADAGFNSLKLVIQWRWGHRAPDAFYFDDLDGLLELADRNHLSAMCNFFFDVAPVWLFDHFPDARMITASGAALESKAVICRQIGGYPGPCFNHPQAWQAREQFLRATISRYAEHPAMGMWDVWNEPESHLLLRKPKIDTLLCYCDNCRAGFIAWLARKYAAIDRLNDVWGRCYANFDEIELPRDRETFSDMVDWRLFQLDSLTAEARRRIDCVKSIDDRHPVFLHPVPNTMEPFNAVTGADDFALAEMCDCFGGTVIGLPSFPVQAVSAARRSRSKVSYNVESHVRFGVTGSYPRSYSRADLAAALLPQIGLGVRGILFWQYRCETLGREAPGWGLLDPDGHVGVTHTAATEFWQRLRHVASHLEHSAPADPAVAIFKSNENEIFRWCMDDNFDVLRESVDGFTKLLFEMSVPMVYVNPRCVIEGLPSTVKVLILPCVYAMDQSTADALVAWVRDGGVLLCEGLTAAFDLTRGRHATDVPGLGLTEAFGLREINPTAVRHLTAKIQIDADGAANASTSSATTLTGDAAKALAAMGGGGGELLPIALANGSSMCGRHHYAELDGEALAAVGGLPGRPPCIVQKRVGRGCVFYAASEIGWQWGQSQPSALRELMQRVLAAGDVDPTVSNSGSEQSIHIDRIPCDDGEALVVFNFGRRPARFAPPFVREPLVGLMSETALAPSDRAGCTIAAGAAEMFVPRRWLLASQGSSACESEARSSSR